MRLLRQTAALLLVISWSAGTRSPAQDSLPPPSDQETLARAALAGWAANVQAFPFYQCRYVITTAKAKSIEDAIQGKFINAISYENRLLVDGDNVLYEGLAPPQPVDPKQAVPIPGKPGFFATPQVVCSDRYLSNKHQEMAFVPTMQTVNLFSKDKRSPGVPRDPPLASVLVDVIQLAQSDAWEMSTDGLQELDRRPVVGIRFRNKRHGYVLQYFFDPERSYLPVRREYRTEGKVKSRIVVTHVRECSSQRWFPERTVKVSTPDKTGDLYDVSENKIIELNADERPAAADFRVTVPGGTVVCTNDPSKGYFKLKQDETIHVDDILKLFAMLDQKQVTPLMDTAIPRSSRYRWLYWTGAGVGLVLALVGLYAVWRKLRPQVS